MFQPCRWRAGVLAGRVFVKRAWPPRPKNHKKTMEAVEPKVVNRYENGVAVHQVTDDARLKDNIYCERSYCSPDSRFFIYQREISKEGPLELK